MKPADVEPAITALAEDSLYPAVLELFGKRPNGRILDVPSGHGAFARELLRRGYDDIRCLDILPAEAFELKSEKVMFRQHDVIRPLPYPAAHFDYVFSLEGIEHLDSPWTFVCELCRVLKPGGSVFISTPNTFSVDARIKYLLSGYFPRFRPLMQEPERVLDQRLDDAHVSPIYFWQLNYFLLRGGVRIARLGANALVKKPRWANRALEILVAAIIRRNMRRRGFPDPGVTSDAVLFGDCLIVEGEKA